MEILIIIICIVVCISCFKTAKEQKDYKKQCKVQDNHHLNFLKNKGIVRSKELIYNDPINCRYIWFIADDVKKVICIATERTPTWFKIIPYEKITAAKVVGDSEVYGVVSRAVVGAALAGTAGAIIGAQTAKQQVTSYKLVIEINDISEPDFEINLITRTTKTNSEEYKNVTNFARQVISVLRVIIYNK